MSDPATESYVSMFRNAGVAGNPCDEWEIAELQRQLGVEFPPAYKAFLTLAGQGFAPLQGSHHAAEDDLSELQEAGRSIAEHEKTQLPAGAFVFLVHQGCACLFFVLHDMDDPAVFECVEGLGPPRPITTRFSNWVLEQLARSRALKERRIQ
jgi:hypothetical protein